MTWVGLSLAFIVVTPMRVRPPLHSPKRLAMNSGFPMPNKPATPRVS